MSENLMAVPGSSPLTTGGPAGYPSPTKEVDIKLALRTRVLTAEAAAPLDELLSYPPHLRQYPTHDELAAIMGGYAEDMASIETYFESFGIRVKSKSLLLGRVILTGSVTDFERAFHTEVATFQGGNRMQYLATTSDFQLPAKLLEMVDHAQPLQQPVRKESRLPTKPGPVQLAGRSAGPVQPQPGYSIQTLGQAYKFPADATGEGQVIGLVELGGKVNQNDLKQFFAEIGIKKPRIVEVGTPPPSTGSTELINNAEVALDLEVAGALAPQARLVVYYGSTLIEALQAAVGDEVNKPTVLSISWAGSEFNYSADEVQQMNLLLYQASILGITIVAASADHGAYNGLSMPNVSLPSSSPLVLGCGGTIATLTEASLTSEVVWNEMNGQVATGGGYSHLYTQPYYQAQAVARYPYQKSVMRGVPDVAADASMLNSYQVVFGGQHTVIGGTSGATPFVAALLALLSEKLGYRLGYLNTVLYGFAGSQAFRPVTTGNNQLYLAAPYWNPCTGLGSIVGTELLQLLQTLEQASTSTFAPKAGPDDTPAGSSGPASTPGPGDTTTP
jgi:kumamolisin